MKKIISICFALCGFYYSCSEKPPQIVSLTEIGLVTPEGEILKDSFISNSSSKWQIKFIANKFVVMKDIYKKETSDSIIYVREWIEYNLNDKTNKRFNLNYLSVNGRFVVENVNSIGNIGENICFVDTSNVLKNNNPYSYDFSGSNIVYTSGSIVYLVDGSRVITEILSVRDKDFFTKLSFSNNGEYICISKRIDLLDLDPNGFKSEILVCETKTGHVKLIKKFKPYCHAKVSDDLKYLLLFEPIEKKSVNNVSIYNVKYSSKKALGECIDGVFK